jgi:hypothetical protein
MSIISIGGCVQAGSNAASGIQSELTLAKANASGVLDTLEIYVQSDCTDVKIATMSNRIGLYYTARSPVTIGNVPAGSKQTFTGLSVNVVIDDILGCYKSSGIIYYSAHAGYTTCPFKPGVDWLDGNEHEFLEGGSGYCRAFAMTGATVEGHPAIKRFGGVPFCTQRRNIW